MKSFLITLLLLCSLNVLANEYDNSKNQVSGTHRNLLCDNIESCFKVGSPEIKYAYEKIKAWIVYGQTAPITIQLLDHPGDPDNNYSIIELDLSLSKLAYTYHSKLWGHQDIGMNLTDIYLHNESEREPSFIFKKDEKVIIIGYNKINNEFTLMSYDTHDRTKIDFARGLPIRIIK